MKEVTVDPITYEILSHRLWQIVQEMAIAVTRVTGSTVTIEAKDLMVGLYDEAGNLAVSGAGVLYHSSAFQAAIKHIMNAYSESPGIYEGDVFMINDPYICAVHKPDAAVLSPIFYQGELIAWAGSMTHLIDIGSIDPGGFSPRARETYQEGFNFRGIKLVERGQFRNEIVDSICSMSRDPAMVGLDLRGEIAGGEVAKRRVMEIIDEHGVELFRALLKEVIKHSELRLRRRLLELPDGVWRTTEYLDSDGLTDKVYNVVLTLTKRGDQLLFDFTGTSEQAPTYINCSASGLRAGVFGAISVLLAHDIPWNQGLMSWYQIKCPEAVVVNCRFPAPLAMSSLAGATYVFAASVHVISKMLSCSDRYKEEATGLWGPVGGATILTSANPETSFGVVILMDMEGLGGGARTYADGIDTGGHVLVPFGSLPNVERYEALFPILYLFRRQASDSGGPGRYRGGVGGATAIVLHDFPTSVQATVFGTSMKVPVSFGIGGGYPGGNWTRWLVKGTDIEERFAKGQLPQHIEELKGSAERITTSGLWEVVPGDVYYFQWNGGGGYGDPLDREPEPVRRDVMNGLVSLACSQEAYGVVLTTDTWEVDWQRTEQKRNEIRQVRAKAEENTVAISLVAEIGKTKLSSGDWVVKCPRCGHAMKCTDDEFLCLSRRRALTEASPAYAPSDVACLQEYYCPGCLTLLHTEVVANDH